MLMAAPGAAARQHRGRWARPSGGDHQQRRARRRRGRRAALRRGSASAGRPGMPWRARAFDRAAAGALRLRPAGAVGPSTRAGLAYAVSRCRMAPRPRAGESGEPTKATRRPPAPDAAAAHHCSDMAFSASFLDLMRPSRFRDRWPDEDLAVEVVDDLAARAYRAMASAAALRNSKRFTLSFRARTFYNARRATPLSQIPGTDRQPSSHTCLARTLQDLWADQAHIRPDLSRTRSMTTMRLVHTDPVAASSDAARRTWSLRPCRRSAWRICCQ